MFRFLHYGIYLEGQISTRDVPSALILLPEVDQAIDRAWVETSSKPGVRLFNGRVCRYEAHRIAATNPPTLTIDLSYTDYRTVVGTNFANPQFADEYGPQVMANPLGVSTGLVTADGYLMFGRRNRSVAYYPDRIHPFAGSIEVEDSIDLFANVRRELREELSLESDAIDQIICLGLAEDMRLRHPETIYMTWTRCTREQIEQQVDTEEHHAAWSVKATPQAIDGVLANEPALTPIAKAVIEAGRHLL